VQGAKVQCTYHQPTPVILIAGADGVVTYPDDSDIPLLRLVVTAEGFVTYQTMYDLTGRGVDHGPMESDNRGVIRTSSRIGRSSWTRTHTPRSQVPESS